MSLTLKELNQIQKKIDCFGHFGKAIGFACGGADLTLFLSGERIHACQMCPVSTSCHRHMLSKAKNKAEGRAMTRRNILAGNRLWRATNG